MRGERGRACRIGGTLKQRLQRGGIGEQGSIAAVEVKQGVGAGRVGHHSIQADSVFLPTLS